MRVNCSATTFAADSVIIIPTRVLESFCICRPVASRSTQKTHTQTIIIITITNLRIAPFFLFTTVSNMHIFASVIFAALASIAHAQTPSGFTPQIDTKLEVIFNSTMVNMPGQQMAKAG